MRKEANLQRFWSVAGVIIFCLLGFWASSVLGAESIEAAEDNSTLGNVKIEGQYIERLVLRSVDNVEKRFDQPGETISLAPGEYKLWEVRLEGEYFCYAFGRGIYDDLITVDANKPAVLKVGAPLKQSVKVKRQGGVLVLSYELAGLGGETYTSRKRTSTPTFAIYKGDKEIASGAFEYG